MMTFSKNKKFYLPVIFSVFVIVALILAWPASKQAQSESARTQTNQIPAKTSPPATFNKNLYSVDEAVSVWVIVNKGRVLPSTYVPTDLIVPSIPLRTSGSDPEMHVRRVAALAIEQMFAAAKADGVSLMLSSGYRSYAEQVLLYNRYVSQSGVQQADTFSARPGHSEHQTGLAADIEPASQQCEVDQCFANLPEGKWLAANSYKYGFIIRYQKNTQALTGYEYEPWHVRYVGQALAEKIFLTGQTLEQFFGLPAYTNYPGSSYEIKG